MAELDPLTWTAVAPAVADFNTEIRDRSQFLLGHATNPKPGARVTTASPFTVSSTSTWTTVPLDSTVRDRTGDMADGVGLEIPLSGAYLVGFTAQMSNVACNKDMRVLIDSTTELLFDSAIGLLTPTPGRFGAVTWYTFTAGQTLELQAWRDGSTSVDVEVAGARSPVLWAIWEGL